MGQKLSELEWVRRRLDALDAQRLACALDPVLQVDYEHLCAREQALIAAQAAPPATGRDGE